MKALFYLLVLTFCAAMFIFLALPNAHKSIPNVMITPITKTSDIKLKIIFVVTSKDIDFDKMPIDEIIDKIENDTLIIKAVSPEVYIKPQIVKVYKVEDITCPYLKKRFKKNLPGELVYQYRDNLLIKLNDGVIKLYHYEIKINLK